MSNKLNIKSFTVYELFGKKDHTIHFSENQCIIMGINGTYKTTMLTIFSHFLKGEWDILSEYVFSKIKLELEDTTIIEITRDDSVLCGYIDMENLREFKELSQGDIEVEFRHLFNSRHRRNQIDPLGILSIHTQLIKLVKITSHYEVVFLPSYRHIESKLVESAKRRKYIEQIVNAIDEDIATVGMDSILVKIKNEILVSESKVVATMMQYSMQIFESSMMGKLSNLSDFEIQTTAEIKEDELQLNLDKVQRNLTTTSKQLIVSFNKLQKQAIESVRNKDYNKSKYRNKQASIKAFNVFMLMSREIEQHRTKIDNFFKMCNKYFSISNKEILKDNFSVDSSEDRVVQLEDGRIISLKGLSSGEQQILSIFSRLYLFPEKKDIFIIIDEPEMSLSMPWQNNFIPDILSGVSTVGLLVATHSPDIIEKIEKKYIKTIQTNTPLKEEDNGADDGQ